MQPKPNVMETDVFTPEEVARAIKVSPRLIREWCRSGKIQAINIGEERKRIRITEDSLKSFLDSRKIVVSDGVATVTAESAEG